MATTAPAWVNPDTLPATTSKAWVNPDTLPPTSSVTGGGATTGTAAQLSSFTFEGVAARLVPFDFSTIFQATAPSATSPTPNTTIPSTLITQTDLPLLPGTSGSMNVTNGLVIRGANANPPNVNMNIPNGSAPPGGSTSQSSTSSVPSNHPLGPLFATGGLIFPYMPEISEGINVKYEPVEVLQSNESFYAYRNTDNVRIEISNAVWTCDTFENARYALAALHFFRSYRLMDYGAGKGQTGRPPSPMWFSAYGNYAFQRVPVLLERATWTFPSDIDYVGIPEPGTKEWVSQTLAPKRSGQQSSDYTWMPIKFVVSSISLIVQHAPNYWLNQFNLSDYRNGNMIRASRNGGTTAASASASSSTNPIVMAGQPNTTTSSTTA
jgi:hypothetical protein